LNSRRADSQFPCPKGNTDAVNRQGIEEMEKILRDPDVREIPNRHGGKDVVLPNGKGFSTNSDGTNWNLNYRGLVKACEDAYSRLKDFQFPRES
jgi:hypothetical protein